MECITPLLAKGQRKLKKIENSDLLETDKKIAFIFSSSLMINLGSYTNKLTLRTLVDRIVDIIFHTFNFALIVYAIRSLYLTTIGTYLTNLDMIFIMAYVLEWLILYLFAILLPLYYRLHENLKLQNEGGATIHNI